MHCAATLLERSTALPVSSVRPSVLQKPSPSRLSQEPMAAARLQCCDIHMTKVSTAVSDRRLALLIPSWSSPPRHMRCCTTKRSCSTIGTNGRSRSLPVSRLNTWTDDPATWFSPVAPAAHKEAMIPTLLPKNIQLWSCAS